MNKTIKKFVILALSVALCLPLAACGGGDGSQGSGKDKITIWSNDSHSKDLMLKLIREFNDGEGRELGVEVEYTVKGEDYSQALEMAITAGNAPDMFQSNSVTKYSQNGVIIALDDVEGGAEYIAGFPEEIKAQFKSKIDGKIYKAPFSVTPQGLIYNKDMFKKYGIVDANGDPTPPKTFSEMREYAKKMTQNGDYGMIFPVKSGVFVNYMQNMSVSAGGHDGFDRASGKYDYSVYEPVMQTIMDMKHDGSFYPGADGLDNDPARALFAEGGIGMFLGASYDVAVFTSQFPAKCDWDVAPYPVADVNDCYCQDNKLSGNFLMNKASVERIGAEKMLGVFKWIHGSNVLKELYKNGEQLPYDGSVVEGVELNDDIHPAWKKFMEISDDSKPLPGRIGTDLQGTPDLTTVLNNIWAEKTDISSALADLTERSNAGISKYEEANPPTKLSQYIISGYSRKK